MGMLMAGCSADSNDTVALPNASLAATATSAATDSTDNHAAALDPATGIMYAKSGIDGGAQLLPVRAGDAGNGTLELGPAVMLEPEQHHGNRTIKLCGENC
jgi:hypothetical protein